MPSIPAHTPDSVESANGLQPNRRNLTPSLVFSVVALLLLAGLVNPRTYGSNDNFGIIYNARAGSPTPYSGYTTTYFLHILFSVWPNIQWLGIELYLALLSAAAVVTHQVVSRQSDRKVQCAAAVIVGCCFLPFMLRPDYNSSSILLGGSAAFLLAFSGRENRGWRFAAVVVLLCYWSYSIRRMGFYGSVCFAAPFLLVGLFPALRTRKSEILLIGAVVSGLIFTDRLLYNVTMTPEYRKFTSYNYVRSRVYSSPYVQSGLIEPKVLAATGWSANDYWMFSRWFYLDEDRFDVVRLDALSQFIRNGSLVDPSLLRSLRALWADYWKRIVVVLALSTLAFRWNKLNELAAVGVTLFVLAGAALSLKNYWDFPDRVALPLLAVAALGFLCMSPPRQTRLGIPKWLGLSAVVALVSYLCVDATLQFRRENLERNADFLKTLEQLNRLPADSVILFEGGVFEMDWSDPLRLWSLTPRQIRTGMSIFSPVFYESLRGIGIKSARQLFPFLAESGRGYVVIRRDTLPHLVEFVRATYGFNLLAVDMGGLQSGALIYKVSRGTNLR